ncbi:hypothetical protein [Nocardioides sp. WS12]|uniref:hypothetical protein n=1 Tax=Nocardioides sp. WS12 TaxID=2486272 RepID=UPI0015F9D8B0|nr:hypothetical protein [Nocardioides sp. WS12]
MRESLMVLDPEIPEFRFPETEHERMGVAVWIAWHEVVRGRALVGDLVPAELLAASRDDERHVFAQAIGASEGRPLSDHQQVTLLGLAEGLRAELVRPGSALPVSVAREVMARQVATVLNSETRPAA